MQWLMRIVCIGYVVFLTMLLLTSDPARLIGFREELPWVLRTALPAAHAISFFVLSVLALMTRWPVPRWEIVLILAIYGGMTEIIQGFLPPRAAEWTDWFQDLVGIAIGAAFCWAVIRLTGMFSGTSRSQAYRLSASSDDWGRLEDIVQHSTVSERSWWN